MKTRRHNWKRLREGLACVSDQIILPEAQPCSNPSWFGFLITVRKGIDCIEVVKYIERKGIQTRRLFAGNLIKHPCFDEMRCRNEGYRIVGNLKNTDRIMKDSFWVGVYPGMDDARIDYMIAVIKQALQNQK